jgi:hypothetical protein
MDIADNLDVPTDRPLATRVRAAGSPPFANGVAAVEKRRWQEPTKMIDTEV